MPQWHEQEYCNRIDSGFLHQRRRRKIWLKVTCSALGWNVPFNFGDFHIDSVWGKRRWQESATWFSAISRLQCWSVHVVVLSESEYSPTWRSEWVLTAAACSTTDAAGQKQQQKENPLINFLFFNCYLFSLLTVSSTGSWRNKTAA